MRTVVDFERVYARVTEKLPPRMAAGLDWRRPSLGSAWGGPFNGQRERQELMRQLVATARPGLVVETGTFRGTSTDFLASLTGAPIHTIESSVRQYLYSRRRLSIYSHVHVHHGDSREVLARLGGSGVDEMTLFYLDAHWNADLPLAAELKIIGRCFRRAVVVVDDFRVDDDLGYGYDDYGDGLKLSVEILPLSDLRGWSVFAPAAPAEQETGARRGCIILASPDVAPEIASLPVIRQFAQY